MKLQDYLNQSGLTATQFAAVVDSSVSSITRAARGHVTPSKELMEKIFLHSGGRVTPNDFFDLEAGHNAIAAPLKKAS
jgi:transcriptional regulator with XRE-family HTH domain